jgi:hypothetical protein
LLTSRASLERQEAAIQWDADGPYLWGEFERLLAAALMARDRSDTYAQLYRHLRAVQNRLTDIRTIVTKLTKLDWMNGLRTTGELDDDDWMFFATSDVVAFLANTRGLLDHLAWSYRVSSAHPNQVSGSFRKLRASLVNDEHSPLDGNLPPGVPDLVRSCEWFESLRDTRDGLLHRDAKTLIFPGSDGITVALYGGGVMLPEGPGLVRDNDIVDFENMAAGVSARLHELLEESSAAIAAHIGLGEDSLPGWSRHPGLCVVAHWTQAYLAELDELGA